MKKTDLQKTALIVMQGFLDQFSRTRDPQKYRYSRESFEEWVRTEKAGVRANIHGASMFLIRAGLAGADEYDIFIEQLNEIAARVLAEFQDKTNPEQPA
jgi:hypothetical protein